MANSISKVKVIDGGFSTTLQDGGRPRSRSYGVPPGGALDRWAWATANQLVENLPGAAALEIILQGPTLLFETSALVALGGADLRAELSDGRSVPPYLSFFVRAGQRLTFRGLKSQASKWGRCTYLAIHGGLFAPLVMGSRSTYLRAAIGGYNGEGRALIAGDTLETYAHTLKHLSEGAAHFLSPAQRLAYGPQISLRIVPGPYLENFAPEALSTLLANSYTLTSEADRMGFRLEGPKLWHLHPDLTEIESCPAVSGAIQIPANGQPIVLMADHQVTGGYPIIASIIYEDLPLLAQLLPGSQVAFRLAL